MLTLISTSRRLGCLLLECSLRKELESRRRQTCPSGISWPEIDLFQGSCPLVSNCEWRDKLLATVPKFCGNTRTGEPRLVNPPLCHRERLARFSKLGAKPRGRTCRSFCTLRQEGNAFLFTTGPEGHPAARGKREHSIPPLLFRSRPSSA